MMQGEQQEPWDGKGPQSCTTAPQLQPREVACARSALPAEKVPITLNSATFVFETSQCIQLEASMLYNPCGKTSFLSDDLALQTCRAIGL